jgi:homoserine O-succinyltransferase/O-acetyltransferase
MFVAMETGKKIKIAILDLYEGEPNEGMRCLHEIIRQYASI